MPYQAGLLTIGNELLKGSVLNTNAAFLGQELTQAGFMVLEQIACRDEIPEITARFGEILSRCDLVIVSGGLGPTPDDVTREGIAAYFHVPLVFSSSQYRLIRGYYRRRGRSIPAIVRREAMFPANAAPLLNRFGIALGFTIQWQDKLVVVLPGVPSELEKMFRDNVKPLIRKCFRKLSNRPGLVARMVGVSEPEVMRRLRADFFEDPFEFGIYPDLGEITLRLQADKAAVIQRLKTKIRKRLQPWLYAMEDISLSETIGRALAAKRQSLAVAESCTGGRLASEITRVPGSSRYFFGGAVAYDNALKQSLAGVSPATLKKSGAVSPETALELARGIRRITGASYGIGITGVAGPEGGTQQKPVGLVYLALVSHKRARVWKENFWGDRFQVQAKAVTKILEYLWRDLKK